ncbi:unnamed protein product [Trichobilharzia szidati]|nr:unnamed protein product [Trichobilharzia szidati]
MKSLKKNKSKESSKKTKVKNAGDSVADKSLDESGKPGDFIHCKVRLLDDTQAPLEFTLKKSDEGSILFKKVCQTIGDFVECDYFGLRYTDKGSIRQWLELDKSVHKQLKDCKSYVLNFRVKHYPPDPVHDLAQNISRYLMYLQIRRDLTQGRLLCPPALVGKLGALVAQAELGDAPPDRIETPNGDVINHASMSYEAQLNGTSSTESTNISSIINYDQSIQGETMDYATCCDMLRKLKIIFNQTPEVEAQIMKEYQNLRGLKPVEAETELLMRASQLPTYGIDPVPATPMQKIYLPVSNITTGNSTPSPTTTTPPPTTTNGDQFSVNLSSQPVSLPEGATFYLGITGTGVVTFVGRQRSAEFTWDQIHRLACDGKLFLVYLKKDGSVDTGRRLFRTKYIQHSYRCKSKAAALAFWHWAVDRKCFFTLKQASEAKKIKPSTSIFNRSHSYRFSGRSQQELRANAVSVANLPQPSFSRVSSFRKVAALYPDLNGSLGRATLPGRLRAPSEYSGNRLDKTKTLDEASPLMTAFTDMPEKRIPDTVVEQPCEEDQVDSLKTSPANKAKKITESGSQSGAEQNLITQAAVESWIEPTKIVQQMVVSETKVIQAGGGPGKDTESHMVIRKRVESSILPSADYTQAVNAFDKTLDQHINMPEPNEIIKSKVQTYMNSANGEVIRLSSAASSPSDDQRLKSNGPVKNYQSSSSSSSSSTKIHTYKMQNGHQQQQSSHGQQESSLMKKCAVALTATSVLIFIGVIVILETTPATSNQANENFIYSAVRYNSLMTSFQEYVYTPLRRSITDGFSAVVAYINP